MVGPVEKRVVWHPLRNDKFAVAGGSDIRLYEWAPETHQINHITSQSDLPHMKCFAWCPDASIDDLVAVGMTNGKVELLRLEATKTARDNVLSSGPQVTLPVRSSRSCNALSFCPAQPTCLAVGLDKVRGDPSLVIWDIATALPKLSFDASSEPSEFLVTRSASQSLPPITRQDNPPRTDARILHQHAQAETISALAFLPHSSNFLVTGISNRWLRLYDLRLHSTPTVQIASKVQGICADTFDAHRIATFGDGTVSLWDTRRVQNPLLTFTSEDARSDGARLRPHAAFAEVEFSRTRRGMLATLERDALHVRFWDILNQESSAESGQGTDTETAPSREPSVTRTPRLSWANPTTVLSSWAASANAPPNNQLEAEVPQSGRSLLISDTRRTKNFHRPLCSFALVPDDKPHPLTSKVMLVNPAGDLELYAVHDTPKHPTWSPRGELAIGTSTSYRILPGFRNQGPVPEPWDVDVDHDKVHTNVALPEDVAMATRGRPRHPYGAANSLEEDFPPLRPTNDGGLSPVGPSPTRKKARTFSPAALRNLYLEPPPGATPTRGPSSTSPRGNASKPASQDHPHTPRTPKHRTSRRRKLHGVEQVVENDVSMRMRLRAIEGYGLGSALHNSDVNRNPDSHDSIPPLDVLWAWIHHSRSIIPPGTKVHGYDFGYHGVLGIWEGFPTYPGYIPSRASPAPKPLHLEVPTSPRHSALSLSVEAVNSGNGSRRPKPRSSQSSPGTPSGTEFHAALVILTTRRGMEKSTWEPKNLHTSKVAERRLGLQLCDWPTREDDFVLWEQEGRYTQVACWLVFNANYTKAMEVLMKSKEESHFMISGTLAALTSNGANASSRSTELREHCERLIWKLQDPHLRAMLTQLISGDWLEVLEDEALPLRERLAIALQFLDDKALSGYLHRLADRCVQHGELDGLRVTGLTAAGMDILQSYVDSTGDVQTAAILAAHVCPARVRDRRAERWVDAYRELLDGWRLFHQRCEFDIECGRIMQEAIHGEIEPVEWVPRQLLIRCNYCNKNVGAGMGAGKATACPGCGRSLPRCSICLLALDIVQDGPRDAEVARSQFKDTIDDAIVVCQTCRHGGHASHILDWFFGEEDSEFRRTCPVADCTCRCGDEM